MNEYPKVNASNRYDIAGRDQLLYFSDDCLHPKADQQIIQMMIRDIQKNNDCLEDFIVQ